MSRRSLQQRKATIMGALRWAVRHPLAVAVGIICRDHQTLNQLAVYYRWG